MVRFLCVFNATHLNYCFTETVWEPPKDGYLSLKEQKDDTNSEWLKQIKQIQKQNQLQEALQNQLKKQDEEEQRARLAREKLKERRVVNDLPPETCGPLLPEGKTDPYGQWQRIKVEYVWSWSF